MILTMGRKGKAGGLVTTTAVACGGGGSSGGLPLGFAQAFLLSILLNSFISLDRTIGRAMEHRNGSHAELVRLGVVRLRGGPDLCGDG